MNTAFTIDVVDHPDAIHLVLAGELDLATAPELSRRLAEVETDEAKLIVVDLTGVPFVDSTGLRVLLEANARSETNGRRLRLTRGSAQAQKLFALAGVLDKLPFLPATEGAAAAGPAA